MDQAEPLSFPPIGIKSDKASGFVPRVGIEEDHWR